ncbi:MAG: 50S ribosomal protein L29 [Peptococcaceae bacterium BICA1-7]|nr:MAG: 50S ribosomal protein L29 [Peptococcaceae bacterium BICA1-7]HBV96158.1 50S ribosomal protein L29 [Desulfotomaculum sp.]
MKVKEIKEMSADELKKALDDSKDELFKLKFQLATGQLDNPMRIKEVKKDIARVKTIIRQRELGFFPV